MFLGNIRLNRLIKCNKAVDNYPHALEFVPDCYKTQEMCNKAVNIYRSTTKFVLKYYET